ncbi:MAG: hypothetical protein KME45_11115 [Stenomitos rutilans HA7619-LM2]|nr:hypothetical protein [Stenomitos rutilans HA7619-LM2]
MKKVKVTDPMFAKAIADLSANNTLFFTSKQLLYFLDKRFKNKGSIPTFGCFFLYLIVVVIATVTAGGFLLEITTSVLALFAPAIALSLLTGFILSSVSSSAQSSPKARQSSAKSLQAIGGLILIAGIIASLVGNSFLLFVISVLLGVSSIYLGTQQRRNPMLKHQEFTVGADQLQGWLDRWQQINGSAQNMLPPTREERTPTTVNPDVTAYSFDRLVVCDTSTIAQLLIANNFHFENNCAILSITGYPKGIFDTTMTMLRRNPDLKVYAFHDCAPRGVGLIHQLRTSAQWFQDSTVEIFDVGLLPRQVFASQSMFVQNAADAARTAKQMPTEVRSSLSTEELAWLEAGNCVELESFTPQQLIHILNRGIAGSRELGTDDSSLIFVDSYGVNSYYVVESFG